MNIIIVRVLCSRVCGSFWLFIICVYLYQGEEGGESCNEEDDEDVMESAGENEEEDQVNPQHYKYM